MGNKMVYAVEVVNNIVTKDIKLWKQIKYLACDGIDYTAKIHSLKPIAIVFANICSYGGGFNLWGKASNMPQYCDDQKIEVMGGTRIDFLNFFTLGRHLPRIAQAKEIHLVLDDDNYMQIDGEPWFNQCNGGNSSEKEAKKSKKDKKNDYKKSRQSDGSDKNSDENLSLNPSQSNSQTPTQNTRSTFGIKIGFKNSTPMLLGPREGKMSVKGHSMMKIESSPLARTITTNKFFPTLNMDRKTQSCDQAQSNNVHSNELNESIRASGESFEIAEGENICCNNYSDHEDDTPKKS